MKEFYLCKSNIRDAEARNLESRPAISTLLIVNSSGDFFKPGGFLRGALGFRGEFREFGLALSEGPCCNLLMFHGDGGRQGCDD